MPKIQTNNSKHQHKRQQGFTLLELLVVIGLLGLVAMSISSLMVEDQGIKRQEVTEKRWDEIRKAIIGDTSRTLNGEPMLSGYVADMGRLPANLNELLELGDQPVWISVPLGSVTTNTTGELSGGWRGPYLYTGGSQFFRDGWGNVDPDNTEDNKNFGWVVGLSGTVPNITDIAVQSLGFNNAAGGDGYDEDSPSVATIANANGWQLNSSSVTFNVVFNKPPTADQNNLELRVYFFEDDAVENLPKDSIQLEPSLAFSHVVASASPHTESATINGPLPMGKIAVVVWCATESKVYDGNCLSATNTKQPYYYTLLPSTVPPIAIPWNIP
ncbi:MAG: prepilin-type N-terminal cleavage/methylation domain-containing protein [Methylotenera sp.]|uniref:prepilin-type N-terminal cleavage/methylation domain-containing protein n=1 Tax=Methylotenera sp. TaxID=2051956 RepID=UPI002730ED2D|nr:prepilin-type N-terminal cleavage/methylation domain-containing protein [Methylotenera sp.]MDP1523560.1 prepilin-type N-terminal cleavage/methylation domain-containing protein [Methylotenera sp.]MDZ4211523.1 prepilin-type N-terminal cleavage/methylation domain-containing protein [Methylotenera sp.]